MFPVTVKWQSKPLELKRISYSALHLLKIAARPGDEEKFTAFVMVLLFHYQRGGRVRLFTATEVPVWCD